MKNLFLILLFVSLGFTIACQQAQLPPASKPDRELTKDEAELRIQQYETTVRTLELRLTEVTRKSNDTRARLDEVNRLLKECQEETLRLLGATDADIVAFRQRLGVIEGKIREMQRLSDEQLLARQADVKALENDLNMLRGNKISLIPEFYNKIIALAKDIRGLYREKKITTYTVGTWAENRDCLWNIAGKIDIYADPFMWPKIWQANTDQIRNPDIIHPGQVLQIPPKGPKTSEELKAERKYWRMKKEAQAEAAVQPGGVQ
ncbi:MAG: LysM peptidoglycan-binding domain-containing protein [Candidatus Kapabacteria bacterium]|nr:LysM peptidoglycan-binding domain-containing protein [Candidatus Kapabacteria bacterium]